MPEQSAALQFQAAWNLDFAGEQPFKVPFMWVQDIIKAALSDHAETVTFRSTETSGEALINGELHEDCPLEDWCQAQHGLWLLSLYATGQELPGDLLIGSVNEYGEVWQLTLGDATHDEAAAVLVDEGIITLADRLWLILHEN